MFEEIGKVKELREERAKIIADQRVILDKAKEEKRDLTSDENTNYENMDKKFNELTDEINRLNGIIKEKEDKALREEKLAEREKMLKSSVEHPIRPDIGSASEKKSEENSENRVVGYVGALPEKYQTMVQSFRQRFNGKLSTEKYLEIARRFLIHGEKGIDRDQLSYLESEGRAIQADLDVSGGYLVAPEKLIVKLIKELDNVVFVRNYATVYPVPDAASLGAPARANRMSDPTWTAKELALCAA